MSTPSVRCYTHAGARLEALIRAEMSRALGHLKPAHIVIKPNWVLHQHDPRFPISALVTDARVIAVAARVAAELFPGAERITIGDCPLQRADWPLLCEQSGLTPLMAQLERAYPGRLVFRDLRQRVYTYDGGRLVERSTVDHGDPQGYREVCLGGVSHLDEISDRADRFAIHDHDRTKTRDKHQRGDHRYYVSQSFLDADLIINLPKWKTHSKSGITAALKNLVGINGDKSYLPHFSRGAPSWGGDEYWDSGRWVYWVQNTGRELLRTRWWPVYRLVRPVWLGFKALRKSWSRAQDGPSPDFYVGGGAWHGNQTIWRMIYDLNLVIQCVDAKGVRHEQPCRHYFCIVDGLICGEGDGPLGATPRPLDWMVFGSDPFAIDTALAWLMGFDPSKIPILAERHRYLGPAWGKFDAATLPVAVDETTTPLASIVTNHAFVPAPGWIGHVERAHP